MPHRGDVFAKGHYYHVYNRGAGRGLLFFNPGNYEYCLRLIQRYRPKYGVIVVAYCLMPSHYHFLLKQETDEPLSNFINVLFNAYVQAVNRQQNRTYLDWIGQRAGTLKDDTFIREHFANPGEYCRFVADDQGVVRTHEHIKQYIWD
jgi:REP element-mobilizing transposase RayT